MTFSRKIASARAMSSTMYSTAGAKGPSADVMLLSVG
jgi:hypothetical protein